MSCVAPCATCTASTFASCLSCDTNLSADFTLSSLQCIIKPIWYIQLSCTCLLLLFILLPLCRKRSLVLIKILDIIQTVQYFKFINGFIYYRHNYLYVQMRSVNPWNEGWQLIKSSSDMVTPVFLTEQTFINKLVRIACIWLAIFILVIIVGIFRMCCREANIQFSTFMQKNIKNSICISFYLTIQDISFFCAANYYNPTTASTSGIIFLITSILLTIISFILIIWMIKAINYKEDNLYHYQLMFLYRMDYDIFQTYQLTRLPLRQKKIYRYSNLVGIQIVRKIGYAFLICSFLYKDNVSIQSQIYSILGFLVFFVMLWYIAMPFDPCTQLMQLVINMVADAVMLALLVLPLIKNDSTFNILHLILCLSLFGLAIFSAALQIFRDLYNFIPYDLYNTGLTVVIEDQQLKKQLQRRKKEQQINERRIKEIKQQKQKLQRQLQQQKLKNKEKQQYKKTKPKNQRDHKQLKRDNMIVKLNQIIVIKYIKKGDSNRPTINIWHIRLIILVSKEINLISIELILKRRG